MDTPVYIVGACRTGIGAFQGQFSKVPATKLGGVVIQNALQRAGIEPKDVSEVIMGQVLTAGEGQNPGRQAAINAGFPASVPGYTVNMVCGSGLKAVYNGFVAIKVGAAGVIVAGGQENMSLAKHAAYLRVGQKLGTAEFQDTLLTDGLMDAALNIHMGNTAEHLATSFDVSRERQDEFALKSQLKARAAIDNGYFKDEVVAIEHPITKEAITKDEHVRPSTTIESLAKLRPAFQPKNGTVTAGNASGINDGAAALVICSESVVKSRGLIPLAVIVACAEVGVESIEMGLAPIGAIKKVLEEARWTIDEVDLFEINEAFAVQSILVAEELKIDPEKLNVCGGAIALGHPIGASGARVLVTLLYNLKRLGKAKGIAALCIGGGMGIAIAVQATP